MPDRLGFRVEGLNKLTRDLQALGLDVDDMKAAFSSIASQGAALAARYAPRRTGALAGSVRGNKAKNKAVITAGRARVPYAGPINYGWPRRGIAPAGFMQKADQEMQPKALALLEQEINVAIRKRGLS